MAGARLKPLPSGKYQGWYKDARGKRVFFAGIRDDRAQKINGRKETIRMARRIEDEHRQVALGTAEPTKPWVKSSSNEIQESIESYLAWGRAQGGISGRPWSDVHASKREFYLEFWSDALKLRTIGDLNNILGRVETTLRELTARTRSGKQTKIPSSGKTRENYADGLRAFCEWLRERNELASNPLDNLTAFDCSPKSHRRELEPHELRQLFKSMAEKPDKRKTARIAGYKLALTSGLRVNELQSLTVAHLDAANARLKLEAEWTKNRQGLFQPIPRCLAEELKKSTEGKASTEPLVHVSDHAAEILAGDLRRADLQPVAPGGRFDFHSFRVCYATLLDHAGATSKEQEYLCRHKPRSLTHEVYTRVSEPRMRALVEKIAAEVLILRVTRVHAATGTDNANIATTENAETYQTSTAIRPEGLEPHTHAGDADQSSSNAASSTTPTRCASTGSSQRRNGRGSSTTQPRRNIDPIQKHQSCVAGVHAGLDEISGAWERLPEHVRQTILTIVRSTGGAS